ncbi:MAG: Lrp/AsnC ligand binding domain-containing protein, partial [Propionibacteriaceae bacterium]|nr:Lrp/AsnC ligand binding domain-containing protein [Propionibacteriaceae bacterium]
AGIPQITACYSIAGDASYLLQAQVGTTGELDTLLTELRSTTHVNTTTTVVLSTIFANRPLVHSPSGVG